VFADKVNTAGGREVIISKLRMVKVSNDLFVVFSGFGRDFIPIANTFYLNVASPFFGRSRYFSVSLRRIIH